MRATASHAAVTCCALAVALSACTEELPPKSQSTAVGDSGDTSSANDVATSADSSAQQPDAVDGSQQADAADAASAMEPLQWQARQRLSLGNQHACVIDAKTDKLFCWGKGTNGQLGNGDKSAVQGTPKKMASFLAKAVSAGSCHTCAVTPEAKVRCWGCNSLGQVNPYSTNKADALQPVLVEGLGTIRDVVCSAGNVCVITGKRGLRCWGDNDTYQLGVGHAGEVNEIVNAKGLGNVRQAALSVGHACAIAKSESVWWWGVVSDALLDELASKPIPTKIGGLAGARAVAVNEDISCAVSSKGEVFCWGLNLFGQFGKSWETIETSILPYLVVGLAGPAVDVRLGYGHICALLEDGGVWCWGDNTWGALGDGTTVDRVTPKKVEGLPAIETIALGDDFTCARAGDGQTWCWGDHHNGQLGVGQPDILAPAIALPSSKMAGIVAPGGLQTCAVQGSSVRCWGGNTLGEVSYGSQNLVEPKPVTSPLSVTDITALGAGYGVSCAVATDGKAWCWGKVAMTPTTGGVGKFGVAKSPLLIAGLPAVVDIATSGVASKKFAPKVEDLIVASTPHFCALDQKQALWCWGRNIAGQLGDGSETWRLKPVQVKLDGKVAQFAVGRSHTCALLEDGKVWCWGSNKHGQSGVSKVTKITEPTLAQPLDKVAEICAGRLHTCARLKSGSVRCWGNNASFQLGNEAAETSAEAMEVPQMKSAKAIACGAYFTCAIDGKAEVRCWGKPTTTDAAAKLVAKNKGNAAAGLVKGLAGVDWIKAGDYHACAGASASGKAWCWGDNAYGQIGIKSNLPFRSKPTEVIFD